MASKLSPFELQNEAIAVAKRNKKWSDLTKQERSLLEQYAQQQNSTDPEALFYSLQQLTEEGEGNLQSVVQGDLIQTLTEEYRQHKKGLEEGVKHRYPHASPAQIDILVKILLLQQIERSRQLQLSLQDRSTIASAIELSDPKNDPIETITKEAERLIETAQTSTNLLSGTNTQPIVLSPQEKAAATRTLIAANLADEILEIPETPGTLSENLQLSLAVNNNFHSPIADVARQIESSTHPATEEQLAAYVLQAQSQLTTKLFPEADTDFQYRPDVRARDKETGRDIPAELLPAEQNEPIFTEDSSKEPITIDFFAKTVETQPTSTTIPQPFNIEGQHNPFQKRSIYKDTDQPTSSSIQTPESSATSLIPQKPSPRAWNVITGEPIQVEDVEPQEVGRPTTSSPIPASTPNINITSPNITPTPSNPNIPAPITSSQPNFLPDFKQAQHPSQTTPSNTSGAQATTYPTPPLQKFDSTPYTPTELSQQVQRIAHISQKGDADYLSFLLTSNPQVRSAAQSSSYDQIRTQPNLQVVDQLITAASKELKLAGARNTPSSTAVAAAQVAQANPNTANTAVAIIAYSQLGANNLTRIIAHASQNIDNPDSELGKILRQHPSEIIALAHVVSSIHSTSLGRTITTESRIAPSYYDLRYGDKIKPSTIINPTTGTAVYLENITLPSQTDVERFNDRLNQILVAHDPDIHDHYVGLVARTHKVKVALETNPKILSLTERGTVQINDQLLNEVINAAKKDLGISQYRAFPTKTASQAAAIFEGLDHSNLAAATKLYGQLDPLTFSRILEHAALNIDNNKSHLGKILSEHPEQMAVLAQQYSRVHQSQLGNEIFQEHAPNIRAYITTLQKLDGFYDRISRFNLITRVPGYRPAQKFVGHLAERLANNPVVSRVSAYASKLPLAGTYLNYILHPRQAIQSYIARQIGQRVVRRFVNMAGEALLRRVSNEVAKKAIETVMKQGLKRGVEFLAKQGLKRGIQLVVQGANVVPGLGIVIAVAVEVLDFLLKKIKQGLDSAAMAIWGERVKARDLLTIPILIITSSVGVTLGVATAIMIFLYLFAFTTAPIIGSLAQIGPFEDRGGSYTSREAVISKPADLTGIDECPSRPPVNAPYSGSGYITQGPNVGSHTSGWSIIVGGTRFVSEGEAIDYGIPTNTRIYATHKGQAYYYPQGSNSPSSYGNWVAIVGVCTDPTNDQKYTFVTTYAHLRTGNIPKGGPTAVNKGDLIGLSNNTGYSTGPHLHYEIMGLGDILRYL